MKRRVYVVVGDGVVKVGVSGNPTNRLIELSRGRSLLTLGYQTAEFASSRAFAVERQAHTLLAAAAQGGEWFKVSENEAIFAVADAIDIVDATPIMEKAQRDPCSDGITPGQCRGARGALRWSQSQLARASAVSPQTVKNFEDNRPVLPAIAAGIERALRDAGVAFITEDDSGGVGVGYQGCVVRLPQGFYA